MTNEQKMKFCVEATDGCWHEIVKVSPFTIWTVYSCLFGDANIHRESKKSHLAQNPSPTDLNALFDLAEKADLNFYMSCKFDNQPGAKILVEFEDCRTCESADTPAEALLNALCNALGGK